MAGAPILEGPRVRLRAPRIDDADAIFAGTTSDPEVTRYLTWTPHPDVDETRRVIEEVYLAGAEPVWLVEWRDTGEFVGTCGRRRKKHAVDFGFCLGRRWWGQGIMTEVLKLLIEDAEQDPDVYRIWAVCAVDNAASARVLENVGMTLEGRLARYAVLPNLSPEPQDCLMFGKAVR
jgi:[ribosomal protein S5]-alanine N-acetyltransferase